MWPCSRSRRDAADYPCVRPPPRLDQVGRRVCNDRDGGSRGVAGPIADRQAAGRLVEPRLLRRPPYSAARRGCRPGDGIGEDFRWPGRRPHGRRRRRRSGPSACYPGVFTPVALDGSLFVDVGPVSNLPAWVFDAERRSDPSFIPTFGIRFVDAGVDAVDGRRIGSLAAAS